MLLAQGDRVAVGIYCTASSQRCRRTAERQRTGHRFTFASSLIFHTISSMQARASSLESCPSTGDKNTGVAVTSLLQGLRVQHSTESFPRQSQLPPVPCSHSHSQEHPEPQPGI